jgi:hypothetical protein
MTETSTGTPLSPRNRRVVRMLHSPFWGRILGKGLTIVTYTGRRSGKRFSVPVGYRRQGDIVVLQSKYGSDTKTWWRNFLGSGREAILWLDGADRAGHAVATQDDQGRVTVTVTFPTDIPAT